MPNHITNVIKLEGDPQEVQKLLEQIKNDELGIGTVDFNKIIPMPKELGIESSSRTHRGLEQYKDFIEVYTLGRNPDEIPNALKDIPLSSEEAFLKQRNDITPEEWELGKAAWKNLQNYGATTWYEWSVGRWGTKWNAYGYDDPGEDYSDKEELRFLTAWSAPHPVLQKLSEQFPDVEIIHSWADEDIGRNCGRITYVGGIRTEEYIPEILAESISFAAGVMDSDPSDWGLYMNAAGNEYVYGYEDTYQLAEILGKPALYSKECITDSDVPAGLHCFYLQGNPEDNSYTALTDKYIEPYGGTIIMKDELNLGSDGLLPLTDDMEPAFSEIKIAPMTFLSGNYSPEEMNMTGPSM